MGKMTKPSLISGIILGTLSIALLVLGQFSPVEKIFERSVLEKIETQDPGYLRLPVRILNRSTYEAVTFNPQLDKPAVVSFSLTKPAPIRVRIARKDYPELVLRTLADWEHLKLGHNELTWDGRDASGNITANTMVHFVFEGKGKKHARCRPDKCHDLKIEFISPSEQGTVIGSTSDITATIVGDRAYSQDSGYICSAFIDWQPWFKKEFPKETQNFKLPVKESLKDGEHLLAINIGDKYDHLGSATLRFYIRRDEQGKQN